MLIPLAGVVTPPPYYTRLEWNSILWSFCLATAIDYKLRHYQNNNYEFCFSNNNNKQRIQHFRTYYQSLLSVK